MKVHLIAIGGSIMHNLAIALKKRGYHVTGSDDEIYEPAYSRLKHLDILPDNVGWYPEKITDDLDFVILGMHAKTDNPELLEAQRKGKKIMSFPEFIYEQSKNKKRIVIAGSHGKTTVTSMVMHIFKYAGIDFDYAVGSQVIGFEDSIKLTSDAPYIIIEGDEYLSSPIDRQPKFLWYQADIVLINGVDWDHINVFPTYNLYLEQFSKLLSSLKEGSVALFNAYDEKVENFVYKSQTRAIKMSTRKLPYTIENGVFIVDYQSTKFPLNIFGKHNIANLSGAITIANIVGIGIEDTLKSMESYKGASKRLETIYHQNGVIVYRDFAHAPSKVKASVEAVLDKHSQQSIAAFLELNTFSSLNPEFIVQYKNTLDGIKSLFVFVHPDVQKNKVSFNINQEFIIEAFDNPNIQFINNELDLENAYKQAIHNNEVILLMSSGKLAGLNFIQLTEDNLSKAIV
jgi:UDP-N-acetylmuramate: L-alanyl-gamma-D-glutamyl-meso-diaminopimelate ligase